MRIDIRNLWLEGLKKLQGKRVVGIGKHVCGAATDLAIKCLCQANHERCMNQADPPLVVGVGIALCCRHACTWEDYVDHSWILDAGFSPENFATILHLSTWAHQDASHQQEVGRICKRFLDAGRVRFLRNHGLLAVVKEYVPLACSKENHLLLALKSDLP